MQCDELRPSCRRCQNLCVACPGYRPENELVFRDMNDSIEKRVIKKRSEITQQKLATRPKYSKVNSTHNLPTPSSELGAPTYPSESNSIVRHSAAMPIRNQLSSDWDDIAMCRFFADYVIETDDLHCSPGFLDKLPQLYNAFHKSDSVLNLALSAVSLSNYSYHVNSGDLQNQARRSYGRGLVALNRSLSQGLPTSDHVLAGVIILNMYEVCRELCIFLHYYSQSFLEMFSGDKSPQKSIWETHGDALGMVLQVIRLIQAEDVQYHVWEDWNANTTNQRIEIADKTTDGNMITPPLEPLYPKSWLGHRSSNVYRAARIILLQTLSNLTSRAASYQDLFYVAQEMNELHVQTRQELNRMVTEISESTDAVLDNLTGKSSFEPAPQDGKTIAAYSSVFPLKVALSVKSLSEEQRKRIIEQLQFIEKTLGLGQARTIRRST